jgi:putative ABC transport system substrate-binding protein
MVLSDSLVLIPQRERIAQLAIRHRLPTVVSLRRDAEAGGLLAYGYNDADLQRARAAIIDKIFRGARPADLPIQGPSKFDLVINLKTARALGLTLSPQIYALANEVIE